VQEFNHERRRVGGAITRLTLICVRIKICCCFGLLTLRSLIPLWNQLKVRLIVVMVYIQHLSGGFDCVKGNFTSAGAQL